MNSKVTAGSGTKLGLYTHTQLEDHFEPLAIMWGFAHQAWDNLTSSARCLKTNNPITEQSRVWKCLEISENGAHKWPSSNSLVESSPGCLRRSPCWILSCVVVFDLYLNSQSGNILATIKSNKEEDKEMDIMKMCWAIIKQTPVVTFACVASFRFNNAITAIGYITFS